MQSSHFHLAPEGSHAQRGLREVAMPHADAGLRSALRSAYAPCSDLPAEFTNLLNRLR